MRGPHVTPGYLNDPERTADAFDHEGFYRSGDAVRLAGPNRPEAGVVFDGRLAEDFKLTSGTWVAAGALRVAAIAACAGFGAVCGSSLATASTVGEVGLPELRRAGCSGAPRGGGRRRPGPSPPTCC